MEQLTILHQWALGWSELALINACLAQIKNNMRDGKDFGGLAWFFISLLIGPFATLCIILFKKPTNLQR